MIEYRDINKGFLQGRNRAEVLRGINFTFEKGGWYTVYGVSGSGKSTFLNVGGGLDEPDSGTLHIDGEDIYALNDKKLSRLRNSKIGFIFQFFHLISDLSVYENIVLPLSISGMRLEKNWLDEISEILGIEELMDRRPSTLSGGEQQRVAMARAIINRPEFIFADEPTGNLDSGNSEAVMKLLRRLKEESGVGVILATHDKKLAFEEDIILKIEDGVLLEI